MLCRLALIFRTAVRLRVTEMEWCLVVVVLFDAWHEIGRDGVCEHAIDLISQSWLCLSDGRLYRGGNVLSQIMRHEGSMQKRVRAMWNLVNFKLKGSTSLLFLLKWHSSRWICRFIAIDHKRSTYTILHLFRICVSNTCKVERLGKSETEIAGISVAAFLFIF